MFASDRQNAHLTYEYHRVIGAQAPNGINVSKDAKGISVQ